MPLLTLLPARWKAPSSKIMMNDLTQKLLIVLVAVSLAMTLNASLAIPQALATDSDAEFNLTNKLKNVGGNAGYSSQVDKNTLPNTIGSIIKSLLSILGIIFMAYIIYAGYLWMSARGNEEQLTKAKAILRGSIIGLIIVLGAYAITQFVLTSIIEATGYSSSDSN